MKNIDTEITELEAKLNQLKADRLKNAENAIFNNFVPSDINIRKVMDKVRNDGSKLLEDGVIVSTTKYMNDFQYEPSTSFSFGVWTITNHERFGGHEGAGETHYIILKVDNTETGDTLYFKVPGWYASYDGSYLEWDQIHAVAPKEKTIIVWER